MEKSEEHVFIIYESSADVNNENIWIAYRLNKIDNLTYKMLIDYFVKDYKLRKPNQAIDMKNISLSTLVAGNIIPIGDLTQKITENYQNFFITFDSSKLENSNPQNKSFELNPNLRESFYQISTKFFEEQQYLTSFHFAQLIKTYGVIQMAKICYKLKKWEVFKKIVDQALINLPKDYSLLKIAADFFERTDTLSKAISIYKNYSFQYPIFKVAYYRTLLTRENQPQVESIVNDALLHLHSQKFDVDLLFECAKIYIKNNEFEKAINLCFLNQKFLLKAVKYFCSVPTLPKTFRKILISKNLSPKLISVIAHKMFYYNEISNSLKLIDFLYKNNKTNVFCALSYMNLLFKSYNYNDLIDVIVEFFSLLPKHIGKFPIYNIFTFLQTSSTFRSKIFNPQFNPDADLNDYEYSETLENTPPDGSIEWTDEENYYFELILMLIGVFHVIIGDAQWFKNFQSKIGSKIVVDKKSVYMFHYIEELYLSSVYIKASMQNLSNTDNSFLVIGDIHSISSCNTKISLSERSFYITSLPIENLSIYDLVSSKKKSQKELFYKFITKAEQFSLLMLVIGTYDCEKYIPKLALKKIDSKQPVTDAISDLAHSYMILLSETKRKLPYTPIIIHGAIPRYSWSIPIVERFNSVLKVLIKRDFMFISPFPAQSSDNYFTTYGLKENLPDARYPLTIASMIKKFDL